ncbi:hypothetical protein SASPL_123948 [Salvia splendens]|uniref:FHA domain-containing protein n=1 Tax=Salvia splendens TaxID=180675 RepID=A0A8X8ZTH2_SALSN|nr:hypothetical protein SASPL_123948 [Salvia splendens]
MAAAPLGGFLVPVNGNSKEEKCSIPKIVLSHDTTYIGRDISLVADKRLSRRHIAVTISADGSADILVEGSNPVVIQSKGQRNKLLTGAKWKIRSGDVIELIPGHYLFKYVAADDTSEGRKPTTTREKRPSGEESSKGKQLAQSRKRVHRVTEEEALAEKSHVLPFGFMVCLPIFETVIFNYSGPGLQDVLQRANQEPNTLIEGIRNF